MNLGAWKGWWIQTFVLGFEKKFDIVVVWLRVEEFSDATGDSCCRIRVFFYWSCGLSYAVGGGILVWRTRGKWKDIPRGLEERGTPPLLLVLKEVCLQLGGTHVVSRISAAMWNANWKNSIHLIWCPRSLPSSFGNRLKDLNWVPILRWMDLTRFDEVQ